MKKYQHNIDARGEDLHVQTPHRNNNTWKVSLSIKKTFYSVV